MVAFPKRRNRRRALRKQWDDKGSTNGVMSMSTHRHAPSARLCVEKERKRERKKKRRKKEGVKGRRHTTDYQIYSHPVYALRCAACQFVRH